MAELTLTDLRHTFSNGHVGLHDVNLEIRDGEFVALVGPSGSGKTTLLRSLAGFIRPSSGEIRIDDRVVCSPRQWRSPEKRNLSMVFQDHAVWPHLSVFENVAYPLKRQRVAKPELRSRVTEVLTQVGLEQFADRKPAALSGGQRQRVALARAIVANPRALLLDEALSALDEPLRVRLRQELVQLTHQKGLTAVHVTHDRTEALAVADRVLVLEGGRVIQDAPPQQLLKNPETRFVANFISDASEVPGSWDGSRFTAASAGVTVPGSALATTPGSVAASQSAVATLAPEDITLVRPTNPDANPGTNPGTNPAVVTAVLDGRFGADVTLEWAAGKLTAHTPHTDLEVGDRVEVRIDRAHVFLVDSEGSGK